MNKTIAHGIQGMSVITKGLGIRMKRTSMISKADGKNLRRSTETENSATMKTVADLPTTQASMAWKSGVRMSLANNTGKGGTQSKGNSLTALATTETLAGITSMQTTAGAKMILYRTDAGKEAMRNAAAEADVMADSICVAFAPSFA